LAPIGGRWSEADLVKMIPDVLAPREGNAKGVDAYAGIGSRETPQDVLDEMTAIATVLEGRGFRMRSGGAGGADTAFDEGVLNASNKDIILPWKGFSGIKEGKMLPSELEFTAMQMALKYHPAPDRLWDQNGRPKPALKLHTRNMPQVLGLDLKTPAKAVIAYTPDGAASGGTGQAIRVAEDFNVPVINLRRPEMRAAVLAALDLTPERVIELAAAARGGQGSAKAPARAVEAKPFIFSKARDEQVWDRSKSAVFFKGSDEYGACTNMSPRFPYRDGGLDWKSSEHQYQAGRFPDRPDLQAAIYDAPDAFAAKRIARDNAAETRADWQDMNVKLMAYVVTRRRDAHPAVQSVLEKAHSKGLTIVEQSSRDPFWGAVERNGVLKGRNMLGAVLDQAAAGARQDELPRGTTFPTLGEIVKLREARLEAEARGVPAPVVRRQPDAAAEVSSSGGVRYTSGDVSADKAEVIVNTVNARLSPSGRGVMGAGVAKAFKERFPSIMGDYEQAIRSGELREGTAMLFDLPDGRKWAALATKADWRDPSQMEWVESSTKQLAELMKAQGLKSVALPPPGCGNGKLEWSEVEPVVLKNLQGLDVTLYAQPSGAMDRVSKDVSKGAERPARTGEAEAYKPVQPEMKASMYFSFGRARRPGLESKTTFEAILSGERTSTTRFDNWRGSDRWGRLKEGAVVRFYEDKEMQGRFVDVRVTGVERVDLKNASEQRIEDWSKSEGWSVEAGREYGRKNEAGWQVRYEPIPGQEILKERHRGDDDLAVMAAMASRQSGQGR
jgi:ribA/ribD-fused uncharacterized protein